MTRRRFRSWTAWAFALLLAYASLFVVMVALWAVTSR